ncbi:MAG: leucine-rich repeat protein [Porcipelethomonas sp.]
MKKIFSFLTSAVIAATCLCGGFSEMTGKINLVNEPLTAKAVNYSKEVKYGDYLYYKTVDEDEDGTYDYAEITDCDETARTIDIPFEIDGLPVKSIGNNAFENCCRISYMYIPDTVISIGSYAFSSCQFSALNIPDSVTSIGDGAFYGCSGLKRITIPDSVTSIGCKLFYSCESLISATLPDSVTSIGANAFSCCSSLSSITLPESVESIGALAFSSCYDLTSITIPDSVTSIDSSAFCFCRNLESVTIGNGVTSIGKEAFYNCTNLKNVIIGNSVTNIGENAFYNCTNLAEITIPDSVTSIEKSTFQACTSLKRVSIPDSVTSIGENAFYECTNLAEITIPDSVASIEKNAFLDCTSLETIIIPDSVTSIGENAFYGCISLASIIILSPECDIYNNEETIPTYSPESNISTVIYCYKDSTAHKYAEQFEKHYSLFLKRYDIPPVTTAPVTTTPVTTTKTTYTTIPITIILTEPVTTTTPVTTTATPVTTTAEKEFSDLTKNEFHIKNKEDFLAFAQANADNSFFGKTIYLDSDIDMKDTEYTPSSFAGLFDGQYHKIVNLTVNTNNYYSLSESYEGLFKFNTGTIVRLDIVNADITVVHTSWNELDFSGENVGVGYDGADGYAGGICAKNYGTIAGCTIIGSLTSVHEWLGQIYQETVSKSICGGICGENHGTIQNCSSYITDISGTYTGGICGSNPNGVIKDCYIVGEAGSCSECSSQNYLWGNSDVDSIEFSPPTTTVTLPVTTINTIVEVTRPVTTTTKPITTTTESPASSTTKSTTATTQPVNSTTITDQDITITTTKPVTSTSTTTVTDPYIVSYNKYSQIYYGSQTDPLISEIRTTVIDTQNYSYNDYSHFNCDNVNVDVYYTYSIPWGYDYVYYWSNGSESTGSEICGYTEYGEGESYTLSDLDPEFEYSSPAEAYKTLCPDMDRDIDAEIEFSCHIPDQYNTDYYTNYYTYTDTIPVHISAPETSVTTTAPVAEIVTTTATTSIIVTTSSAPVNTSTASTASSTTIATSSMLTTSSTTATTSTTITTSSTTATTSTTITTSSLPVTTSTTTVTSPETSAETESLNIVINNLTVIVISCDEAAVNVLVPSRIDGNVVVEIGKYAFYNCDNLQMITIENPECEIYDDPTTINENAVISGYWNSTAHDYAIKYNRQFYSLNGEPEYLPGDISGNDKIDLYDAIEVCRYIMGMRTFTEAEKQIADYDGNGKVDLYDAIGIAKKLLEK